MSWCGVFSIFTVSGIDHIAQDQHVDNNNSKTTVFMVSFIIGDAVQTLIPESFVGRIKYHPILQERKFIFSVMAQRPSAEKH